MDAKDRRIAEQDKRIAELEAQLKAALEKIAQLEKNSSNSSKPPSSDIVKPPQNKDRRRKKKIGAQKGHKQHLREPFKPEQVDHIVELKLEACPKCKVKLKLAVKPAKKHQQVEFNNRSFIITEYQQIQYWCPQCHRYHTAKLPVDVQKTGLFGKNMIALTALLKGHCHMSFTKIQTFYAEVVGIKVSTGFLAKQIRKTSDALKGTYDTLVAQLRKEKHLHSDETGGKENGERRWTWCFRAKGFTVFRVDPSRGSDVLKEVLGEDFAGKISCDFFSAYQKFARESKADLLHCWAHLIREVKYISENKNKKIANYGKRFLDAIGTMFKTIHRKDELQYVNWFRRMKEHQRVILKVAWHRLPTKDKDAWNIAVRLWNEEASYFRFIAEGLPATNNLAEQSIRRVVLNRKVTQGTRSDWGNRWWERIWSVLATCEQQGKSVMEFLKSCVGALLLGRSAPTLLKMP